MEKLINAAGKTQSVVSSIIHKLKPISYFLPLKRWKEEAFESAKSLGGAHHVPKGENIPEDLQDREGSWQFTENGFPVAGRMLPEEVDIGSVSPVLPLYFALFPVIAMFSFILAKMGLATAGTILESLYFVGFFTFFGFFTTIVMLLSVKLLPMGAAYLTNLTGSLGLGAIVPAFSMLPSPSTIAAFTPALLPLLYLFLVKKKRASRLAYQGSATTGAPIKHKPNEARFIQADRAAKDKSFFTTYGISTGAFSKIGDELAPDANLPVGQTTKDQATNLVIFGSIGSGKTTNIRQIFLGQINAEKHEKSKRGILVLDGKSVLAQDCAKYLDIVVTPAKTKNFNILEGITPEVLARTLENQFAPKKGQSGNSSFFTNRARGLIYYARVFQQSMVECGKIKNSFMGLYQVVGMMMTKADESGLHPILEALEGHKDFMIQGTILTDAIQDLISLQGEADETKQNIFATAKAWLTPFIQSQHLRHWADSETSDFNFDEICYGKKIGFVLPESQLGIAGVVITAMMKARLFTLIADRGLKGEKWGEDGSVPVNLFIDEAQKVMDASDLSILPQGRSLGLVGFYATQNFDNFIEFFGKDGAHSIIESFRSIICLKSSHATYELVSHRIGKARIFMSSVMNKKTSFSHTSAIAMRKPNFDPMNPERTWMRFWGEGVMSRVGRVLKIGVDVLAHQTNNIEAIMEVSKEPMPILSDTHIQLLNIPFTAIAIAQRGGVERRDIIRTIPLDDNFNPIDVSPKIENFTGKKNIENEIERALFGI